MSQESQLVRTWIELYRTTQSAFLFADGGNDALLGTLIASDLEKVEPLGIHEVLRGYLHDLDREIHRIALGDRLLAIVQGGQDAES